MSIYDYFDPRDYEDDVLSPFSRRQMIRNTLPSLIDEGYSMTAAHSLYREAGYGINNQAFSSLYNEAKSYNESNDFLDDIGGGFLVTKQMLPFSMYDLPSAYRATAKITYIDKTSAQEVSTFITVDLSELGYIQDIEDAISDLSADSDSVSAESILFAKIVSMERRR